LAHRAQGYGLTETNATATSNSAEDFAARPSSCGLPTPVTDILIVNDDGRVLPPGDVGEIWVDEGRLTRGPQMRRRRKDGWFKTGDVGVVCAEGFLYIRDRKKDMIIRGGENIDCLSIEEALYTEPGILEAAAVGVPDERLGELPVAVVSVKQGYRGKVTEQLSKVVHRRASLPSPRRRASKCHVTQWRLPRFAVPVMILVRNGELDRAAKHSAEHNAAGKVMKNVLRQQATVEWEKRNLKKMGGEAKSKL
ncbi:hypothetical protein EV714DRAFT_240557, partial [Schizophyllum commune]